MIQFAVGAAVSVFMVLWRWWKLQESKVGLLVLGSTAQHHTQHLYKIWRGTSLTQRRLAVTAARFV